MNKNEDFNSKNTKRTQIGYFCSNMKKIHAHMTFWKAIQEIREKGNMVGWLRDLTMEGVEPNPGPAWGLFIQQMKEFLGSEWNSVIELYLEETFKVEVKKHARLDDLNPVDTDHIQNYLNDHPEDFHLKKHIVDALTRVTSSGTKGMEGLTSSRKKSEVTIGFLVDKIYRIKPQWKCILEEPEKRPVDEQLHWVGRKEELAKLLGWAQENIGNHLLETKTKQKYRCPLVHGGLGVGKTRLVVESNLLIQRTLPNENPTFPLKGSNRNITFNEAFANIGHIFIDISRRDVFGDDDSTLTTRVSLGLRFAAHFFFGVGFADLIGANILTDEEKKEFTFENVCNLISEWFCKPSGKHIFLTVQLDEFSAMGLDGNKKKLNEIIDLFSTHMTTRHELGLCIHLELTGTDTDVGIQAITRSRMNSTALLLQPLSADEETELVEKESKNLGITQLLKEPLFLQALDSLGKVPRYIDFFIMAARKEPPKTDLSEYLRSILSNVVENIKNAYDVPTWQDFLGHSPVGVRTMVLWALCGKEVQPKDYLNGITVEQARSSGILLLSDVKNRPGFFIINLPLVLLRALNKTLGDIPDEFLDPVRIFDDREFERAMCGLRVLRQNLLVGMGRKTAKYKELYPFALGYDEDLNLEVQLQKLEVVCADGNQAQHHSIHKYLMEDIPIMNSSSNTIDATKGGFLIINVIKASSNDALIVHPPFDIEGMQMKSSDAIRRGQTPTTFLKLGKDKTKIRKRKKTDGELRKPQKTETIWQEFEKANNEDHKKFYSQLDKHNNRFTHIIISNKPLANYRKIREAVNKNDKKNGLPTRVLIICNENFANYASCFAHRGLFLPVIHPLMEEEDEMTETEAPTMKPTKRRKVT